MSFVCVSVFFSFFFRFLVKYFQLCIVTSLLPFVVNKAYHTAVLPGCLKCLNSMLLCSLIALHAP